MLDVAGHHAPVDLRVATLPDSPAAMPRAAFRAWCVVRLHGPLEVLCAACVAKDKRRSTSCCLSRVLSLEHDMDDRAAMRAVKKAINAGYLRLRGARIQHAVPGDQP